MTSLPPDVELPSLSITICTRDRPGALMSCVRSITRQTVRPREVLIMDDGHVDPEEQKTLSEFCAQVGITLDYQKKAVAGVALSRNLAMQKADGDIVLFLDDDVTLEAKFCEEILRCFARDDGGAIVGAIGRLMDRVRPPFEEQVLAAAVRASGLWKLQPRYESRPLLPEFVRQNDRYHVAPRLVGAAMAIRRRAMEGLQFDEALRGNSFGDDADISYHLNARGWLIQCRYARATHHQDPSTHTPPRVFGRSIVRHVARIMYRHGVTRVGDRLVILYTLTVLATACLVLSLLRPGRYLPCLAGMIQGAFGLVAQRVKGTCDDVCPT
jgi:GT2 family glycosyltransferase